MTNLLHPATGTMSGASRRAQSTVGSDGLTDAQRKAIGDMYAQRFAPTKASNAAFTEWLKRKRAA